MRQAAQASSVVDIAGGMLGVCFGVALFGLANGGNFGVIAVAMADAGASEVLVGLATSCYFVGALTASLTCGRWVQRWGAKRAFVAIAFAACASTAAIALSPPLWLWPLLRALTGFSMGAYYVVVDSWFNHATANATRGRTLAIYETVRLTAVAGGSFFFLQLSDALGLGVFLGVAALYLAAILPVSLNRFGHPASPGGPGLRTLLRRIFNRAPLGLTCAFVGGVTTASIYGLVPLYGNQAGLSTAMLAAFVFCHHIGAFAVQFPAGFLSDTLGRRGVILSLSLLGAGAAASTALLAPSGLLALMLAALAVGGISHTLHILGVGFANDRLGPADYVGGAAVLSIAYDVGTVIGPILASLAMQSWGKDALYAFTAMVLVVPALVSLRRSA